MSKRPNKIRDLSIGPQQIRIVAGRWRGTKLPVILKDDIRPTPARVKETLFNWLQGRIEGCHCLDLFAGSGALGFEAVSRGAAHATLVDNNAKVIELLMQQVNRLDAQEIDLVCTSGIQYLSDADRKFDIIFLDPPFSKFSLEEILAQLAESDCVKSGSLIYVEASPKIFPNLLPPLWEWQRQSKAGQVEYGLIMTK